MDPVGSTFPARNCMILPAALGRSPANLTLPYFRHTATLLASGQVLIAGGYSVNYTPFASAELFLDRYPATVTFSNLSHVFDGTAKPVSVTTVPTGLAVSVTYNGSPNAPTNVGNYTVIGNIVDPNYESTATNTLTIFIPDISTNVAAAQSVTLAPGQTATASTAPDFNREAGLSATATNGGGSTLLVAVAGYDGMPEDVAVFQIGASYMDIRVWGADANDSLSANFYYPSTISGLRKTTWSWIIGMAQVGTRS